MNRRVRLRPGTVPTLNLPIPTHKRTGNNVLSQMRADRLSNRTENHINHHDVDDETSNQSSEVCQNVETTLRSSSVEESFSILMWDSDSYDETDAEDPLKIP